MEGDLEGDLEGELEGDSKGDFRGDFKLVSLTSNKARWNQKVLANVKSNHFHFN